MNNIFYLSSSEIMFIFGGKAFCLHGCGNTEILLNPIPLAFQRRLRMPPNKQALQCQNQ